MAFHGLENASPIIRLGLDRVNVQGVNAKNIPMPAVKRTRRIVIRLSRPVSTYHYPQLTEVCVRRVGG